MFKRFFIVLLFAKISSLVFASEDIHLYIDNFDASGDTVTFDIMMNNSVPVYGAQLDITSGDGSFTGSDTEDCKCLNGAVPDDCDECYFDFGPDHLKSNYEKDAFGSDYNTSVNSCYDIDEESVSGYCTDLQYDSESECEELGKCVRSNGEKTSFDYDCWISGVPNDVDFATCTVTLESDLDPVFNDSDNNGLVDACEVEHQACENVGVDAAGDICDQSLDSNNCGSNGDSACCFDAGAVFKNWDEDLCEDDLGLCDGEFSGDECGCVYDSSTTWASSGAEWYPYDLWYPYSLPAVCESNTDLNGESYDWLYANTDPNKDDYLIDATALLESEYADNEGNYQYCIVPGPQDGGEGMIPGSTESYASYIAYGDEEASGYNMAGHCSNADGSPVEGFCVGNGDQGTVNGEILDWPQSCCSSTVGALWLTPYRDYEQCTQDTYTTINNMPNDDFVWTAYDTRSVCESNKGIWIGSETGSEGNDLFDTGENLVDSKPFLDIVEVENSSLPSGAVMTLGINPNFNGGGDRVVAFSFTPGTVIWPEVANNQSQLLFSVKATKTDQSGVATIMSKGICQRISGEIGDEDFNTNNCVTEFVFSDGDSNPISVYFEPYIWDSAQSSGYSLSAGANSDGICSSHAGETMSADSACSSYCGDGYCDSASEDYISCAFDCESMMGDGYCDLYQGETFENTTDCVEFGCGDNVCSGSETSLTCASDCPSICGNDTCDDGEDNVNCNQDCSLTCGDGLATCDPGENFLNCDVDCDSYDGDGVYHHIGIGGTEDETSVDYQLVCGDGFYHYEGLTIQGLTTTSNNAEKYDCVDYEIACGDGVYHYLGLTINGITADLSNAETNICTDPVCQDADDYDNDGNVDECYDYARPENGPEGSTVTPILNDGVCDCEGVCGDYSSSNENPGNESGCDSVCGDGFYHHAGNDLPGTESSDCGDYIPASNDGICDGFSGTGESAPNGNGEYSGNDNACVSICGDGFCDVDESCDADCVGVSGDGVCARWTFDNNGDSLENIYNSSDCTYNTTAHNVCGNGICEDGTGGTVSWGEQVGADNCNEDCAECGSGGCSFGEDDNANLWYCYEDCFTCNTEDFLGTNDGCQAGDESADPTSPLFCYECWESCGDGVCEGPENSGNCDGINGDGDCLNIDNQEIAEYSLSKNYPNPFNPATTINYSVKNAGNVKIDIYNVLGQHVYTLVDGYHLPSVSYEVIWDSSSQSTVPISSGVYFYKMISGDFSRQGRMTIVK